MIDAEQEVLEAEWHALRGRYDRMAILFKALQEGGHLEAAVSAFCATQRIYEEMQILHLKRTQHLAHRCRKTTIRR